MGGIGGAPVSQAELDAHAGLADTAHGGLASQAELNAHAAGPHGGAGIGARVTHSVSQSIVGTGAAVALAFDTERWDNGFHDNVTNNSRLTVPAGEPTRRYLIGAQGQIAVNGTGYRMMEVLLNGVTILGRRIYQTVAAGAGTGLGLSFISELAAGDYVQVWVSQSSGVALDLNKLADHSPEFWIQAL